MSADFRCCPVRACLLMALLIAPLFIGGCGTTSLKKETPFISDETEFRTIGVVSVAVAPVFVTDPKTSVTDWMAEHRRATAMMGGGAAGLVAGAVACAPSAILPIMYPVCIALVGELGAYTGVFADLIMPKSAGGIMATTFMPVDTGATWQRQLSERVVSGGRDAGRTVFDLGLREESEAPAVLGDDGKAVDAVVEARILAIKVQGIALQDFNVSIQAESKLTRVRDQAELNKQTHQYQGPAVAFDPMDIQTNNDRLIDQAIRAGLDALAVQIVAEQIGFDATSQKARQ